MSEFSISDLDRKYSFVNEEKRQEILDSVYEYLANTLQTEIDKYNIVYNINIKAGDKFSRLLHNLEGVEQMTGGFKLETTRENGYFFAEITYEDESFIIKSLEQIEWIDVLHNPELPEGWKEPLIEQINSFIKIDMLDKDYLKVYFVKGDIDIYKDNLGYFYFRDGLRKYVDLKPLIISVIKNGYVPLPELGIHEIDSEFLYSYPGEDKPENPMKKRLKELKVEFDVNDGYDQEEEE